MLKFIRILLVVGLMSALLSAAQPTGAQTKPRHTWPGNTQGWYPFQTGSAPMPSFANGPGAPPRGTGSFGVHGSTVPLSSGSGMSRGDFRNTPLSSLSISYWTYNSDTSANNWRITLHIRITGPVDPANDNSADCALEYVHTSAANAWSQKVPTAASGGYTASGGWVIKGGESWTSASCPNPLWPNTNPGSWNAPASWAHIISTYPNAVIAPKDWTTIYMQIYNPAAPFNSSNLSGAIDDVVINGIIWDFEVEPPPAEFFDPGDGRYDPQPGDRLAAYCEAKRVLIYGVNRNSRGFLMGIFEFEALKQAGEKGIYLDKGVDGILSASMGPQGHIWVAWTGGQYNASGRPEHGFAKLVKCE
jgi:hypothetical protein